MKKLLFLLVTCSGIFIFTGCVTEEGPKMKMVLGVPAGTVEFKPVPTRNLSLKMISKDTVYAGEKTTLIFALSNNGFREISIPEWYSCEQDNLIIMVQPWLTGMTDPDPEAWIELDFDMRRPVMHYPIKLLNGNKVLVDKELPFIEMLQVSPGKMRRYFVKAKTNLKSLQLESEIIRLKVLPKRKSGEK